MIRVLCALVLTSLLSACMGTNEAAVLARLDPLMTEHAAALATDDLAKIRATGRKLIATYDAGVGPQ